MSIKQFTQLLSDHISDVNTYPTSISPRLNLPIQQETMEKYGHIKWHQYDKLKIHLLNIHSIAISICNDGVVLPKLLSCSKEHKSFREYRKHYGISPQKAVRILWLNRNNIKQSSLAKKTLLSLLDVFNEFPIEIFTREIQLDFTNEEVPMLVVGRGDAYQGVANVWYAIDYLRAALISLKNGHSSLRTLVQPKYFGRTLVNTRDVYKAVEDKLYEQWPRLQEQLYKSPQELHDIMEEHLSRFKGYMVMNALR
jgi:hypothetical protein